MRLLDARTFPPNPPEDEYTKRKYAILSHTWQQKEVTFKDLLVSRPPDQHPSWAKLRGAQRVAVEDGLDYVWIDTLCIDKSSSVELGEAINSMYRWYHNAEVCYVYLHDVEGSSPSKNDRPLPAAFAKSRWFKRGWTLQELLAPKKLRFYDKNWNLLGDINDLVDEIAEITQINAEAFERSINLNAFSIAQRMSWAAGRETTRLEDRAYSLLGILNVNLDIRYGEGSSAFLRLQETIMARSTDQSILAWGAPPSQPRESQNPRAMTNVSELFGGDPNYRPLLADSPDLFAGCYDIVPFHYPGVCHTMTNEGLRMTSPVLDKSNVLLSCRHQGDPTIALVLKISPKLGRDKQWKRAQPNADLDAPEQRHAQCLIHDSASLYNDVRFYEFIIPREGPPEFLDPNYVIGESKEASAKLWLISMHLAPSPWSTLGSAYLEPAHRYLDVQDLVYDGSDPPPIHGTRTLMLPCSDGRRSDTVAGLSSFAIRLRSPEGQTVEIHVALTPDRLHGFFQIVVDQESDLSMVRQNLATLSQSKVRSLPLSRLRKLSNTTAIFVALRIERISGEDAYIVRIWTAPRSFRTLWKYRKGISIEEYLHFNTRRSRTIGSCFFAGLVLCAQNFGLIVQRFNFSHQKISLLDAFSWTTTICVCIVALWLSRAKDVLDKFLGYVIR